MLLLLQRRHCASGAVTSLLIHVSALSGGGVDNAPMVPPSRRAVLGLSLGAAVLFVAGLAHADFDEDDWHRDQDHDRARLAVERGEARPLSDILARVRPELGGEVVGVAFRRRAGRWLYEFRIIAPDGAMTEVYVDAATAQIVERETH
jgi:uncharacterized membrane protein YkoI